MALIKCPHCGNLISDKSMFCAVCGKGISASEEKAEPVEAPVPPQETAPKKSKSSKSLLVILLATTIPLSIVIIVLAVLLVSNKDSGTKSREAASIIAADESSYYPESTSSYSSTSSSSSSSSSTYPSPSLRPDIELPPFYRETCSFPLSENFVSSGSNFFVPNTYDNYFAYLPSEHWGVYIFVTEKGVHFYRYIFCTGYDRYSNSLSFDAYQKIHEEWQFVGTLEGTLIRKNDRYVYSATMKGGKSATYQITSDYPNRVI